MKSVIALTVLTVLLAQGHCQVKETMNCFIDTKSVKIIEILVVVDTDRLMNDWVNPASKDSKNPTPINHNYAFMITSNNNVLSGQATADMNVKAISGDKINWYGVSESNNFDNQIIVYGISHNSPDKVGPVQVDIKKKLNVFPKNNITDVEHIKVSTYMIEASIKDSGNVNYDVNFAMYTTNRDTGERDLFGYFTWDPVLTIK